MNELANRPTGQIATNGIGQKSQSALRLLPADLVDPVSFFYSFHSDILKGTLCIVTRIRFWIKEYNLTTEEAKEAMRICMSPEACGEITYGGQLQGKLSDAVMAIIKQRKAKQQQEQRKADADRAIEPIDEQTRAEMQAMIENLKTFGTMPEDDKTREQAYRGKPR